MGDEGVNKKFKIGFLPVRELDFFRMKLAKIGGLLYLIDQAQRAFVLKDGKRRAKCVTLPQKLGDALAPLQHPVGPVGNLASSRRMSSNVWSRNDP